MTGASNFDICLIKTPADRFGIHEDISPHFNSIPCLPDKFELEKVFYQLYQFFLFILYQNHGKSCWVAGWGHTQSNGVSSNLLRAIGINLFDHEYCYNHRCENIIVEDIFDLV